MDRRAFLGALGAAAAAGLAGCAAGAGEGPPSPTPVDDVPVAQTGYPSTICESDVIPGFGIAAITEPATATDWSGVDVDAAYADGTLDADDVVVGVERGGRARAYPLSVLWQHEVVNDDLGGPLVVTYCPLCFSGMVAERVVDGAATPFGVSGQLWTPPELLTRANEADGRVFAAAVNETDPGRVELKNSGNLVLYDVATASFWSQLLAEAICGPRTGERLTLVPSTVTSWGEWRAAHPATDVLLPPPRSTAGNPPPAGDGG